MPASAQTLSAPVAVFAPPKPERALYVIGDVHGCRDLLAALLDRHAALAGAGRDWHLVLVGDLIDRGEDSAGVLTLVRDLAERLPRQVTCLKGNHEQMLLDFLRDPPTFGRRWLRNGGLQTLASFGIRGISAEATTPEQLASMATDLHRLLPEGCEAWLKALPLAHQSGNLWVVHAGADPRLPMAAQAARHLIWGHPRFDQEPRQDGIWVAHGHTVVGAAGAGNGRIAIDTGAGYGGPLSMALIEPDGTISFVSEFHDQLS